MNTEVLLCGTTLYASKYDCKAFKVKSDGVVGTQRSLMPILRPL